MKSTTGPGPTKSVLKLFPNVCGTWIWRPVHNVHTTVLSEDTLRLTTEAVMLYLLSLWVLCTTAMADVKPGHWTVKEWHLHPYWAQHNTQQEEEALLLRDRLVSEVAAGNMTVVCNGVTSKVHHCNLSDRFVQYT